MIKPSDILTHLQTYLPYFTDKFSETMAVTSASVGAANLVSVNSIAHDLETGDEITVTQGTIRNEITDVTFLNGIATFTTLYDHQLITPQQEFDTNTISMDGFSSDFNGSFTLIEAVTQKKFTIQTSVEIAPGTLGYFKDDRSAGIKGKQEVTVIDANNYTFTSIYASLPIGIIDNMKTVGVTRCTSAADIDRATKMYTKQSSGEFWLYVIMGDVDTSKDRHTLNDTVAGFTVQDSKLLRMGTKFALSVFFPTQDDLSGSIAQESAYGEIATALISALYAFGFADPESAIQYVTVMTSHGPGEYNSAYYTHVYEWQLPSAITFASGYDVKVGPIATNLMGIGATFDNNDDPEAQMSFNLEL